MARETLFTHRKFLRFCVLLAPSLPSGVDPEVVAVGTLEWLWRAAGGAGDPVLGDGGDVELIARWRGATGALLQALLDAGGAVGPGFIEEVDGRPGVYEIHDYEDHAPEYTGRRGEAEAKRRSSGKALRELRRELGRRGGLARAAAAATDPAKSEANRKNLDGSSSVTSDLPQAKPKLPKQTEATCQAPAPAPAPAPTHIGAREGKNGHDQLASRDIPAEFERLWLAYPEKGRKARPLAERAYARAICGGGPRLEDMLANLDAQKRSDQGRRGVWVNLDRWLDEGRWADAVPRPPGEPDYRRLD